MTNVITLNSNTSEATSTTRVLSDWQGRQADAGFETLTEAYQYAVNRRKRSVEIERPWEDFTFRATDDGQLVFASKDKGGYMIPTQNAYRGLCEFADRAPSDWLARRSAHEASAILNDAFASARAARTATRNMSLLIDKPIVGQADQSWYLRRVASERYSPIHNDQIIAAVHASLQGVDGIEFDLVPLGRRRSHGALVSDFDMHLFFAASNDEIRIDGDASPYKRFLRISHREDAKGSFVVESGLLRSYCLNGCIFGKQSISETRIRHTGGRAETIAIAAVRAAVANLNDVFADTLRAIKAAQELMLGDTLEEAVDRLFAMRIPGLTRTLAQKAAERAEQVGEYGNPRSLFAIANGITELAQEGDGSTFADAHVATSRVATALMRRLAA